MLPQVRPVRDHNACDLAGPPHPPVVVELGSVRGTHAHLLAATQRRCGSGDGRGCQMGNDGQDRLHAAAGLLDGLACVLGRARPSTGHTFVARPATSSCFSTSRRVHSTVDKDWYHTIGTYFTMVLEYHMVPYQLVLEYHGVRTHKYNNIISKTT